MELLKLQEHKECISLEEALSQHGLEIHTLVTQLYNIQMTFLDTEVTVGTWPI